jgi:hypothetical protein
MIQAQFNRDQNLTPAGALARFEAVLTAVKIHPDWPATGQVTEDNEGRFNRPSVVLGSTKSKGGPTMSP